MGILRFTKKTSAVSNGKESTRTNKTQTTTSTLTTAAKISESMDVPVNININIEKRDWSACRRTGNIKVEKRDWSACRRGDPQGQQRPSMMAYKGNSTQAVSTRSVASMPENPHSESPYLWDYDQDIYSSYDVNKEIKESFPNESAEMDATKITVVEDSEESDDPFFDANPLPFEISTPSRLKPPARPILNRRASAPPSLLATITDLPAGDPSYAAPDVTRDLVKKFISEIWNSADLSLIPEVCHPDIRFNGAGSRLTKVGHEGFASMVQEIHEALGNYHCEIHSMVVENNKAFCRMRFTGKHISNLMGYPATGQMISWMGATEFTCVDGRILKVWELTDVHSLVEQLTEQRQKFTSDESCSWAD